MIRSTIAALLCVVSLTGVATAQSVTSPLTRDPAGVIQQGDRQRREQERLQEILRERERERQTPVVEATPPPAPAPTAPPVQIPLERIDIDRSEILSEAELRELIAPYERRTVTLQELQQLVEAINQLYRQKGFVTARAILPPQKVSEGVVKIALIEARIGNVDIESRSTRDTYVQQRLSFDRGELVDVREAERRLRRFNRLQDVQAQLMLRAGTEPGTTDMTVKIAEPPQYNLDLYTDNQGREDTGLIRGGAVLSSPNVLGFRDGLYINAYGTSDTEAVSGGYEMPIGRWDTRLGLTLDYNRVYIELPGVGQTPELKGTSRHVGLRLSQPIVVRPSWMLSGFAEGHGRSSRLEFTRNPPPPPGDELATTDVRSASAGFTLENTDRYGVTVMTQSLAYVVSRHSENFPKYVASVARQQPFGRWMWLSLRATGQEAWDELIPAVEQFQVGGVYSVRGYPEGFQIGDDGYSTSFQMNAAVPFINASGLPGARDSLIAYAFIDHGGVFNHGIDQPGIYLTGMGGGFSMSWGRWVNYTVSVGVPMRERDGIRDAIVHFAVHLTPPIADWLPWPNWS